MKAFLFLTLILWGLSAFAQETWVGFKPVEEVNLPFKEYLENSVVLIATVGDVGELKENGVKIVDISKVKEITNLKKLSPNPDPTQAQGNLRAIQIETCRKQNLRFCPVIKVSSMSTGFFEQGKKLNTCRHAFHNWLVWASRENGNIPVESLSPPMILYSKDREILYNSATVAAGELLKFSLLNPDTRLNILDFGLPEKVTKTWISLQSSDVAQFTSNTELLAPQNINSDFAIEQYSTESPVYLAGYPGKTDFFSNGEKGEAPGGKLVVSVGAVIHTLPEQQRFVTNNLYKTGSSGAPLINAQGQVMGVLCYGKQAAKDQPETAQAVVFSLNPPALQEFWPKLVF